ncbi:MAG: hypothetical protein KDD82_26970 [Planctomycetes bacterium]|nr:hypothetical protein [Planctomycetota bacterium]
MKAAALKAARQAQQQKEAEALARKEARVKQRQEARSEGVPQLPPEVGQAVAEARCTSCKASIQNTVQVLLERVVRNRVRCDRCGKPLSFSSEVTDLHDQLMRVGDADLREQVDYRCPRCDRTMTQTLGKLIELVQRDRATCQVCGAGLEFPPEVHQALSTLTASGAAVTRRTVNCPICDRGVVDDTGGSGSVSCSFCGVGFALSPQSTRGIPPPLTLPAAPPAELAPFLERVAAQSPFAAELLQARAQRGEVTFAEAVVLAARLEALRAWAHSEQPVVPMPPEEAVPVLACLFSAGAIYHTDRRDMSEGGTLFLDLGGQTPLDTGKAMANVLSMASLASGNDGRFFLDLTGETVSTDLCLTLTPAGDSCCAVELGLRKNGGKVHRLPRAHEAKLREAFAQLPLALATYYLRHVLFGPWAGGRPLFLLNAHAAAQRLQSLGLPPQRYGQALGF